MTSQNINYPTFELSIKSIDLDSAQCDQTSFTNNYNYGIFCGSLQSILPQLFGTNRVSFNSEFINPVIEIKFKGIPISSPGIVHLLGDIFSFKVHDDLLLKEVWVIKQYNSEKLLTVKGDIPFSSSKFDVENSIWSGKAVKSDAVVETLESILQWPVVSDWSSANRYDFEIPINLEIEDLKIFMYENYGLSLEKEYRTLLYKIVTFE